MWLVSDDAAELDVMAVSILAPHGVKRVDIVRYFDFPPDIRDIWIDFVFPTIVFHIVERAPIDRLEQAFNKHLIGLSLCHYADRFHVHFLSVTAPKGVLITGQ